MTQDSTARLSLILPAKNEAANLESLLPRLVQTFPSAEIVVVNDGSSDNTSEVCGRHRVREIRHPYPKGNGASVKAGARVAKGDLLVFMDADGQHRPEDIRYLLDKLGDTYDMVVGARNYGSHAGTRRLIGNILYNRLASLITGHRIRDLTSGFRIVKADLFRKFIYLLPNGFSYPTTITMAFFRSGYSVGYVPIDAQQRTGTGKSHIRLTRDSIRFLIIIFKIGTLYSPIKIFFPIGMLLFLSGLGLYLHNYAIAGRFTNMSALLLLSSIIVFLVGLISEQITSLMFAQSGK